MRIGWALDLVFDLMFRPVASTASQK